MIEISLANKCANADFEKIFARKGYTFFTKGDYNLNIIGVRHKGAKVTNHFDDCLVVIYNTANEQNVKRVFVCTTLPGKKAMEHPMQIKGTAILKEGQYRGAYKIGYHKFPSLRGTLDKIYYLTEEDGESVVNKSRRGLPEWVATSERKIKSTTGKNINLWDEEVYVFPKWDGVSCIFEFKNDKLERALTRGFTETNEAQIVTHIFEGWAEKELNPDSNFYGKHNEYAIKT